MKTIIAIQVGTLLVVGCGHTGTEPVVAEPFGVERVVTEPVVERVQPVTTVPPRPDLTPRHPAAVPAETRVSVSSVNLGDYCPEVRAQAASRFAPGALAPGGRSHCHIVLHVDGAAARFRVLEATLIGDGGQRLVSVTPNAPQIWQADGYRPWNEQLGGGGENVLYSLSNLDWSRVPDSYSRPVRVEIVVEVDGVARTLTSAETVREAMIVT